MGYAMIDNRASGGKLEEFDTRCCVHCSAIIAVLNPNHPQVKSWTPKRRCSRCNGPVCKACASNGVDYCNPIEARVEHAVKTGQWDPNWQHRYRILPN